MQLNWKQTFDSNGNSLWIASSGNLKYRIRQRLMNNTITYYDASDTELDTGGKVSGHWTKLPDAKAHMENLAKEL